MPQLDHLHRLRVPAAQVREVLGTLGAGEVPEPPVRAPPQQPPPRQLVGQRGVRQPEEGQVRPGQGHLGGGGAQVRGEHVRVGRVEGGRLHPGVEDGLGVVDEEAVQRVVAGHQHRHPLRAGATRPAGLLPQGHTGARPAGDDDRVQAGDVDAELERVGRRQRAQLPAAQRPLQLTPLLGQVATAVGGHPGREVGVDLAQVAPGLLGDDLGAVARAHEHQRAGPGGDQIGEQVRRLGGGAAAGAVLEGLGRRVGGRQVHALARPGRGPPGGQRRLPQRDAAPPGGGGVLGDRHDRLRCDAHQPRRGEGRLRGGRRRADDARGGRRSARPGAAGGAGPARRGRRAPRGRRGTRRRRRSAARAAAVASGGGPGASRSAGSRGWRAPRRRGRGPSPARSAGCRRRRWSPGRCAAGTRPAAGAAPRAGRRPGPWWGRGRAWWAGGCRCRCCPRPGSPPARRPPARPRGRAATRPATCPSRCPSR